ncbi:hypothetical protein FRC07_013134 [Ceratobasidium sp. 392]|nr:hypothetical protein FRC07_013134 [Ceratobasidium sp. 392]
MLASDIKKAKHLNPMFIYSSFGEGFSQTYDGTFPYGFHLAPAFTAIASDPMGAPGTSSSPKDLHKRQFSAWCGAFRASLAANCVTIRIFCGDAVSFCRALDFRACTGSNRTHFFNSYWRANCIDLTDHAKSVPPAPFAFDVIETSNLVDLGLLNILLIVRPLLKENPSSQSILYTEQLLLRDEDGALPFSERSCATIPTISALLGIAPLPWLSGFTTHSNVHEPLSFVTQSLERITWVDPVRGDHHADSSMPLVSFNADDLALVLFGVYDKVFKYEQEASKTLSNLIEPPAKLRSMVHIHYHRDTIGILFQLVKRRVCLSNGSWATVSEKFLELVLNDQSRKIGMDYYEDLCLQLHLHGIHTVEYLEAGWRTRFGVGPLSRIFRTWSSMPAMVCVVLTVPRARLREVLKSELIEDPANSKRALLKEDPRGVTGTSDLIVSFWAPSHVLISHTICVALAFKPTIFALSEHIRTLGPDLHIWSTNFLLDDGHVQVLNHRPSSVSKSQLHSESAVASFEASTPSKNSIPILAVSSRIEGQQSVISFTARVEIEPPAEQLALLNGADIIATQITPCTMKLSIADHRHIFPYPFPVFGARHRLRVARKSHYIEVIVPVSEPLDAGGYSLDRAPIIRRNSYTPWNLHHINVDLMPLLDLKNTQKLGWLNSHTALQISDRERAIMGGLRDTDDVSSKLLASIKDTIHSLPNHYSGAWKGKKDSVFGLCEPGPAQQIYAILLVGGLRLDLASFTVIVDTAVIPSVDQLVHKLAPLVGKLEAVKPILRLTAIGDEANAWRKLLPAFIERSRTWIHKPNCEYKSRDQIPVSFRVGESPICTCGLGIGFDAAEWQRPLWKPLLQFATRAAISPFFAVPFIESSAQLVRDLQQGMIGMMDPETASRLELINPRKTQALEMCSVQTGKVLLHGVPASGLAGAQGEVQGTLNGLIVTF